ncbi:MAG TPA: radical SAM protein [Candidatus Lokiarchaeia archaeon]|nr:radical SAM protein [Candidatus Lokiarchaeia archaeon]
MIEPIKFFAKWPEFFTTMYFRIRALSLQELAAFFPDDTTIIDGMNDPCSNEELAKIFMEYNSPNNIIGISAHSTANARNAFYTLKLAKSYAPLATVMMGGYHATFFHKRWIMIGADVVIRHEAEISYPRVIQKLQAIERGEKIVEVDLLGTTYSIEWLSRINGEEEISKNSVNDYCNSIPSKWREIFKIPLFFPERRYNAAPDQPFSDTLDEHPFPDRSKLDQSTLFYPITGKGYMSTIESARGCPFSCEFCSTRMMWKQAQRFKSVPRLMEEIKQCLRMNIDRFLFIDESWGINNKHANEFMDALEREGLHIAWAIQVRVDTIINNPALFIRAGRNGCQVAMVGFETLNQGINDECNKKTKVADFYKAKKVLADANIMSVSYFLVGLPNETRVDWRRTIQASKELAELAIIQPFVPYFKGTFENVHDGENQDDRKNYGNFSLHHFSRGKDLPQKTRILNRDLLTYILMFTISPKTVYRAMFRGKTLIQQNQHQLYRYFYKHLLHTLFDFKPQNFVNVLRAVNAPIDA